jgi:hypothetical protein
MSETSTTLFQPGVAVEEAPPVEPEGTGGNRRTLMALAGLGLLLVLGVAAYFLFFTGGSDPAPATPTAASGGTAAQPSAAPVAPVPVKPATLPKISAKNFGTDPFNALVTEPTAGDPAATGDTAAAAGSTATTTDTGSTASNPDTTTTTATKPTGSQAYRFQVVKVAADNSTVDVKVNGKSYKGLQAGEVFAKIFKVRFVSGQVNSFQIGDEVFNVNGSKAVTISG